MPLTNCSAYTLGGLSHLFGPESINSGDGWTIGPRWQSKFKFAKSSHTAPKTGRVVNSERT